MRRLRDGGKAESGQWAVVSGQPEAEAESGQQSVVSRREAETRKGERESRNGGVRPGGQCEGISGVPRAACQILATSIR